MSRYYSRDDLANLVTMHVPLPMIAGHKTGIADITFVAKFQTFYLKLTYSDVNDGYRIEAYLYNTDLPRINLIVPRTSAKDFLNQFKEDNYLRGQYSITWPIKHNRDKHH